MSSFKQGDLVQVNGTFDTADGTAVDPTGVQVTIVRPDGQINTYTYGVGTDIVRDAVGRYHINISAAIAGAWVYRWHSSGTGQAAEESNFYVEAAISTDPPGDPESLSLSYSQILREVGRLLGLSREPNKWPPESRQDVSDIIRSGLRRFYWSPVLPNADGKSATVHSWSFLKGTKTIATESGVKRYKLPVDFGEMLGGVFTHAEGSKKTPVGIIGEEQLRQLEASLQSTGVPQYAALSQLPGTPMGYEVVLYPSPDAAYSLTFDYAITPPDLSATHPHPYGGAQHAETILESILAAAEKKLLDEDGLHEKRFQEMLARSIAMDRNLTTQSDESPWPIETDVMTLGVTKAYLKRLIGRQLGFSPHQATWTHGQSEEVRLVLETGLRKFYSPMVLPGERFGWEWRFLKPVGTITAVAGVDRYDLPEDLAILDGPLTHAPTASALYPPIKLVGENQIRYRQGQSTAAGRPSIAAVRAKTPSPQGVTRWELIVWPAPDGDYELTFNYQVNPSAMPDDTSLPHGGQPHAQTVIEACLCAAEEHQGVKNGIHGPKFLENLIRSVGHDRKASAPASLGRNTDYGDLPEDWNWHESNDTVHRYNGALW